MEESAFLLSLLAGEYSHFCWRYGKEPTLCSRRQKRRMRRSLKKTLADTVLSQDIARQLAENRTDEQVLDFLRVCYEQDQLNIRERERQTEQAIAAWDNAAGSALRQLLSGKSWWSGRHVDDAIELQESATAFDRVLTLSRVEMVEGSERRTWSGRFTGTLRRESARWRLCLQPEDVEEPPILLMFADAAVRTQVYRADTSALMKNPWNWLGGIAAAIIDKAETADGLLNEQERDCLPLLQFLWHLCTLPRMAAPKGGIQAFAALVQVHGDPKLLSLLENVKAASTERRYIRYGYTLRRRLCRTDYEPLWRAIYTMVRDSQSGYASCSEAGDLQARLSSARAAVTVVMRRNGYEGNYPDYYKLGDLRGLHLAESYDTCYLVGYKRRVAYRVHCSEYFEGGKCVAVHFLCGTALLHKNEAVPDAFSCTFDAKGRRFCRTVECSLDGTGTSANNIAVVAEIAVKRAELKRLSKTDRAMISPDGNGCGVLIVMFLFMGTLFGLGMTVSLMLLELLVGLVISGSFASVGAVFLQTPWWLLFSFSAVAFGGAMTVMTALAERK